MAGETERSFRRASRKIRAFAREFEGAPGKATRQVAEEVRTDAVATRGSKGVPRDQGILAGTHRAEGPRADGSSAVTMGGASAPYGIRQHEDMTLHHDVGEARWLVRAVERWRPNNTAALKQLQADAIEAILRAKEGPA